MLLKLIAGLKNGSLFNGQTDKSSDKLKIMNYEIQLKKINDLMIENFQNIFSSNNVGAEFTNYGGIKPPEEILKLLDDIGNENYKGKNKNFLRSTMD